MNIYCPVKQQALRDSHASRDLSNHSPRLSCFLNRLATPYGLMLCAPPFIKMPIEVMRAVVFNPGIKENAGIFNHTQGWGVMAECLRGDGDRAYDYLRTALPAACVNLVKRV